MYSRAHASLSINTYYELTRSVSSRSRHVIRPRGALAEFQILPKMRSVRQPKMDQNAECPKPIEESAKIWFSQVRPGFRLCAISASHSDAPNDDRSTVVKPHRVGCSVVCSLFLASFSQLALFQLPHPSTFTPLTFVVMLWLSFIASLVCLLNAMKN